MTEPSKKPMYPTTNWGAWAADPWGSDIVPDTPAWTAAMKRVWLRNGGTEADFETFFGQGGKSGLARSEPPAGA